VLDRQMQPLSDLEIASTSMYYTGQTRLYIHEAKRIRVATLRGDGYRTNNSRVSRKMCCAEGSKAIAAVAPRSAAYAAASCVLLLFL
jgi:hypothetical protein